ncbi:phosphate ABC transporter substrate-binding protein PstS [Streptomyces boninensis]|uniref:phosphate ABC transporter substrate-binding protein PstS n=1 Tax=Streptomyces boninensis TaxID=2039455 RepID=UPI003B224346
MKLQRKNRLRAVTLGAVAVSGALVLTACGSDDNSDNGGDGKPAANAGDIKCAGSGQLLADGSSAQKNAVEQWAKDYSAACSGVTINYPGNSSGTGIESFNSGKVAFAGSDSPLKPEEVAASKKVCKGGQGINLPMVGGPIAVVFNVAGVDDLVVDAKTLTAIFDGKITKWNDPALKKLNPEAKLPGAAIQPFHRSDESGTTDNFTKYLKGAGGWKYEPEKKWPNKVGQGANGSAGVASQVKQVKNSISYVELSYATSNKIPTAKVDTGASAPVEATSENASKAIAAAKVVGTAPDMAMELDYTTKADGAYPITLLTYEIVCDKGNKPDTLKSVKSFLGYVASEQGQGSLTELGYAPMPDEVITKVRSTLESIS